MLSPSRRGLRERSALRQHALVASPKAAMKAICKIASPIPVVTPKRLCGPGLDDVAVWMPLPIATSVAMPKTTARAVHKAFFMAER